MGLEAMNFFFRSGEPIKKILDSDSKILHLGEKKYLYKKDNVFWIDIELQDDYAISIRITLCNPVEDVLDALHELLLYLFSFKDGVLNSLNTKEIFKEYNSDVRSKIVLSYDARKKVFNEMYGNYTAAISSEEFYRLKREGHIPNNPDNLK